MILNDPGFREFVQIQGGNNFICESAKSMTFSNNIAVFVSFSGLGGVERMVMHLCEGFVEHGCAVDLLLINGREPLSPIPSGVRTVPLGSSHTYTSLFPLARYLKQHRPKALLAAKNRANEVAIMARQMAGVPTRIIVRMGTTLSAALKGKSAVKKMVWYQPMRFTYPRCDAVVAVSRGVADDMIRITGVDRSKVHVIHNPVITCGMTRMAACPVPHPWLATPEMPVVMGVGRLTRQKDFKTLIRAFEILTRKIPSRLIILGEGNERMALEDLTARLGLADRVDFPGHVENPYAYVSRASLFVLSSLWEGSPNVLTEALALGTPVVATDCPSGPREVLAKGRHGPLVPMEDHGAMAMAMEQVLRHPPDKKTLVQAVAQYKVNESSRHYLDVMLDETATTTLENPSGLRGFS